MAGTCGSCAHAEPASEELWCWGREGREGEALATCRDGEACGNYSPPPACDRSGVLAMTWEICEVAGEERALGHLDAAVFEQIAFFCDRIDELCGAGLVGGWDVQRLERLMGGDCGECEARPLCDGSSGTCEATRAAYLLGSLTAGGAE